MRKFYIRWWYTSNWRQERTRWAMMRMNGAEWRWLDRERLGYSPIVYQPRPTFGHILKRITHDVLAAKRNNQVQIALLLGGIVLLFVLSEHRLFLSIVVGLTVVVRLSIKR